MAQANYKVTVTDHDYHYTTYVTWVDATSKTQAIAKGAALVGQEKMRRDGHVSTLLEPDVKLEPADFDEFWNNRDQVIVSE